MRFNAEIDGKLYGVLKRKYRNYIDKGLYEVGYKLSKSLVKDKKTKQISTWRDESFEQNMKDYPEDKERFLKGEVIIY